MDYKIRASNDSTESTLLRITYPKTNLYYLEEREILYFYLVIADEAVSVELVLKTKFGQKLVNIVSKSLRGPQLKYQKVEKVTLALVIVARRLRPYFVAHQVVVCTNQPV